MAHSFWYPSKRLRSRFLHAFAYLALAVLGHGSFAQVSCEPPDGFTPLFTGTDLDGWDGGEVKAPSDFEKMSYQNWYDYRKRMTAGLLKHWQVEKGELIGTSGGPDLVTWKGYGDFEMWVDWKMAALSEAGIALRYGAQIKLIDPDRADGQPTGSGVLATNSTHPSSPLQRAQKPIGQWNRMYVRMVGQYATVILNDMTVVDNIVMENPFDPDQLIDPKGPIHLQVHNGEVRFRNVSIRELSAEESNELLDEIAGDEDKFTPLFNGKNLAGWAGALQGYEVVDGVLRCKRKDFGNIQTEQQYRDFIVRLEFKLTPGSNNGLLIRTPNTNPTHTRDTLEIQILDDNHIMHRQLGASQYHGSAYGFASAARGYLRPTGRWNRQAVYVKGDHIKVELNGYPILDTHLKEVAPEHPASNTKQGHFGLSGYSDPVAFRNIRIWEIDSEQD